jgi:F-type H+-transporting ATPase subunit c
MKKTLYTVAMALVAVLAVAPMAFASEAMASGLTDHAYGLLGAGVAIGFAALGTGIGQGLATNGAMHGISRNPGASGKIMTSMIIGLALIESLCIYALLIAFMIK